MVRSSFSDVARAGKKRLRFRTNIKDNEVRGGIRQVTRSKEKTGTLHLARARAGHGEASCGIRN